MENKNVMLNYDYLEKCDLALQVMPENVNMYKIIKNRESATNISHDVQHVSKAVFHVLFESDVMVTLFSEKKHLKGTNFIFDRKAAIH
jgi:hypothetical protein